MTSEGFHEPLDRLSARTLDHHRAISSLMEEFEAVDWYDQRVDATDDVELAAILAHNRDEEKEHAAMTLEWLRRRDARLDEHLRTYLFTEGDLLEIEDAAESGAPTDPGGRPAAGADAGAGAGVGASAGGSASAGTGADAGAGAGGRAGANASADRGASAGAGAVAAPGGGLGIGGLRHLARNAASSGGLR